MSAASSSSGSGGDVVLVLVVVVVGIALYMLPTIIAFRREHTQKWSVAALNFCLGWTVLGWVGALVWACSTSKHMPSHPLNRKQ